jgi:predicted nuclease of predicted toxin-antitoxin system
MKLLLDENLSRRIVPFLQQNYPDSSQVVLLGLQAATDAEIWEFAKVQGYVIVSRDAALNMLLSNQQLVEQVLIDEGNDFVEIVNTSA